MQNLRVMLHSQLLKAFEQRKDALENLVRLHGQQYFAGPKIPRDLPSEMEKRTNKNKEVNKKNWHNNK